MPPVPTASAAPAAPAAPFFSPSRQEGELVFVSGQMAFDADGRIEGDDVDHQTGHCLARIDAILRARGLGLADVVKATVWLTRVDDFAAFNRSYAATFSALACPAPARSTVRADLMVPGALVEIEAIARCHRSISS
ncbi:MAG: RidA family protein [Variovorax sp.]|jgi:2-iminobutanoate/2-iminopropanoate deaminase|nr:MAG: RidA family protein [Variovorax sp.]